MHKSDSIFKALYLGYYMFLGAFGVSVISANQSNSEIELVNNSSLDSLIVNSEQNPAKKIDQINIDSVLNEFESKRVPVLMFHNFDNKENRYTISPDNFYKLLEDLYLNDFYSVSLNEFVNGDFSNVPVDKKPVLFTFDDAGLGQFMIDYDGSISDKCAVGILEKFYSEYDFGRGGVFFVSFGSVNNFRLPFMQNEYSSEKMSFLVNNGYDVAHHTVFHPNNTHASKNNMYEQNTISSALFQYLLGDDFDKIKIDTFAHPFGASPKNEQVFNELKYNYDAVFDAWGGSSRHPLSKDFNVHKIPRIEITYHTKQLVINSRNNYKVTPDTKAYYLSKKTEQDTYLVESSFPEFVESMPSKGININKNKNLMP